MAKRKPPILAEIVPENDPENNFENNQPEAPEPARPMRTVKNRLHQEWTEQVPAPAGDPAPRQAGQMEIDGGMVGVVEDDDEDESPNEQLFRDLSLSGATNYVSVWELTNWERDRKASTTADGRIFCGTIPIPEHVGSIGELTTFVQEAYAVPPQKIYHFRVVIRAGRRLFKHVPVMTVRSVASARTADEPAAPAVMQLPAPPDPMAQLEGSLAIVERVSKLLRPPGGAAAAAQAAAPVEELSEAGAMLKLIEADPDKLEKLRRRFFGDGNQNTAPDDDALSLAGLLKMALPGLTQMGIAWLQSRAAPPANGQPGAVNTQPTPTGPPGAGPPAMPVAEDMLFANLWNAASQNAPVDQFADWVFNFEKQAPEIGPYLTAMLDFPSTVQLAQFIRRMTPGVDPRAPVEPLMLWFENFQTTVRRREEQREAEELLAEDSHDPN